MSTILEADETETLHLPPSLLPQPGPHWRYHVATEDGRSLWLKRRWEQPSPDEADHRRGD